MRNALNSALIAQGEKRDFCFLTGDLGFMALEPLRQALGERFLNMGIAEQNMVSVAAGLARSGMRPWVYSIAPFCYARPFEQIRNDVCLHNLPVRLVGNGGGYGYGVQGPSHHAIEDCGVMASLQNMQVFAPAFLSDIDALVGLLAKNFSPAYMRLGRDEAPSGADRPDYSPVRKLAEGRTGVVVAFGSIAGTVWSALSAMPEEARPSVWCCCELPIKPTFVPEELLKDIANNPYLLVVEEHVQTGGFGSALAVFLMERAIHPQRFVHRYAKGYISGLYGSQQFHRKECGLDSGSLLDVISKLQEHHE